MHISDQHIVTNFPADFPIYKKYLSNITFWISQIPLSWKRSKLWKKDIQKLKTSIKTGDIILCGNYHEASVLLIPGIVTHVIGHTQYWRCIHATGHGVSYISIKKICRTYDSYILIRPNWKTKDQSYSFIQYLISQIWKPYDFFFGTENVDTYFCSKLINEWLLLSNYDSWLVSIYPFRDEIDKIIDPITIHRALTPADFLSGNFDIITHSSNIIKDNHTYVIK